MMMLVRLSLQGALLGAALGNIGGSEWSIFGGCTGFMLTLLLLGTVPR